MANMNVQGVDKSLVQEFKIYCIRHSVTMKQLVTHFMKLCIQEKIDVSEGARKEDSK
jgi:hypothetical protein